MPTPFGTTLLFLQISIFSAVILLFFRYHIGGPTICKHHLLTVTNTRKHITNTLSTLPKRIARATLFKLRLSHMTYENPRRKSLIFPISGENVTDVQIPKKSQKFSLFQNLLESVLRACQLCYKHKFHQSPHVFHFCYEHFVKFSYFREKSVCGPSWISPRIFKVLDFKTTAEDILLIQTVFVFGYKLPKNSIRIVRQGGGAPPWLRLPGTHVGDQK